MSASTRIKNEALEAAREAAAEARAAEQGLDYAPSVAQAYDEAGKATEPLEPSTPGPINQRTTSFAKTLDEQPTPVNDQKPQEQGKGSSMVEQDQPTPEPTNTMPEADAVRRSQFEQAWTAEQDRANQDIAAAREAAAEARAAEQEAQHDAEQERGHEPEQSR